MPEVTEYRYRQSKQVSCPGRVESADDRCMTPHLGHTGPSGQRASLNHLLAAASVGYRRMNVISFMRQTTEENPNVQQVYRSVYSYPGLFFRTSWSHLLAKGLICPGAEVSVNFVKNKYSPSGDILENLPPG